jgi:lysyl-tRNA synthetase class 2
MMKAVCFLYALAVSSSAFSIAPSSSRQISLSTQLYDIVSPFGSNTVSEDDATTGEATTTTALEGPLELTWDNVEAVLDEMRHFLIQDGGNVVISEIDGPVVRLELQGACGTCPSSTQTMKMGLERGLREKSVLLLLLYCV